MQPRRFGELEAVIMDRVWNHGAAVTVRDVFNNLVRDRQIAYTTVMSTMDNLHRKGWLQRERTGKAFRYWPSMTREEHSATLMRDAFDAGGDSDLVLTFFLQQLDDGESARVREALRRIIGDRDES
ncbi:BlaI/MecI/CopY family transcriptional regulator [Mycobacterium pseudokansasii]|uniref:Transcriptional regulator BlaI n=1 Tax=Mycobacterium pseudokansasii TaxID=2341080 RepID=A0A498R1A2_9MYCO|nr:BlaI/MecI/CopY family transcriptional regulator [Mycobacterium pseudokansasii]KZS64070.1 CopY family transcriptional regulator [Mycobacterium kansasii]VBA32592.1 Transcriptional regulator BlaI [Mycobacterium pseudokansasii]VBA34289.1 Transcriptional regulator BlaI [Mycobacterium pseudokansasii]VBA55716.1 Transcriptional regulator BlaI [Mycobacterium pseudokansasii]